MPLLRDFDSPAFNTVNEVIDFISQTLEVGVYYPPEYIYDGSHLEQGVIFIHEKNVAHRLVPNHSTYSI